MGGSWSVPLGRNARQCLAHMDTTIPVTSRAAFAEPFKVHPIFRAKASTDYSQGLHIAKPCRNQCCYCSSVQFLRTLSFSVISCERTNVKPRGQPETPLQSAQPPIFHVPAVWENRERRVLAPAIRVVSTNLRSRC